MSPAKLPPILREGERRVVDGIDFTFAIRAESTASSFFVAKELELFDSYVRLSEEFHGGNILELGIFDGGSTALLSLLASPHRLVAVDITEEPVQPLHELIADRGLEDAVRPHYGVDQADAERLRAIVAGEFGDAPLDLVIDDASHHIGPTTASFELLFPMLRPGGLYVIEDWNWASRAGASLGPEQTAANQEALATLALEPMLLDLVLARAAGMASVDDVRVDGYWAAIRRGDGDTEVPFRLQQSTIDPVGFRTSPE